MEHSKRRTVSIDQAMFAIAFGRDVDFHDEYPILTYVDLETGEVMWVYEDDDDAEMAAGVPAGDNSANRHRVEADPNRYLEVPGLDHGDHHEILREFLDSDWTPDAAKRARARNAYSGSIGGWKKSINDDTIIHAFHDYEDRRTKEMAEDFLRGHGIEPVWK